MARENRPAWPGIIQDVLKNTSRWTIDQERIYVAGICSGGGATANQGATYPGLFAAIVVHSGGEYGYRLPLAGEQAPARDAMAALSEAEALPGEAADIAAIPPGADPIEQGQKAFQAMGSFARVVPAIVFHGTADHVSDPVHGDQVTQQWITTNHLASPADFTATFEHPSSTVNNPLPGRRGNGPTPWTPGKTPAAGTWSPITRSTEWGMLGPVELPAASSPTRAGPSTSFHGPPERRTAIKNDTKYCTPG